MRAGTWAVNRDIAAAHTSWSRARDVADRMPESTPYRLEMRIAPRTILSASSFRVGGSGAETGYDDLRELCEQAGDKRSLAIGMTGLVGTKLMAHDEDCIPLAAEHLRLLESIGDPELTVGLQIATFATMVQVGEGMELLALAERVISLADGDATKGNMIYGSPLAMAYTFRATARWCLGLPGWKDDFDRGIAMAHDADVATLAGVMFYTYVVAVPWILPADEAALRETADALERAERSGDDVAVIMSRTARGNVLVCAGGDASESGRALLAQVKTDILHERFSYSMLGGIDTITAEMMTKAGDLDGAIALPDGVIEDHLWNSGEGMWALTTGVLVDALVQRGADGDVEAQKRPSTGWRRCRRPTPSPSPCMSCGCAP